MATDPDSGGSIRVFVSSTFLDMVAERDHLAKHTFPALRKLCEERGIVWSDVDLRWGITDERAAEGQVLPICLAEIERSRPYFIGLLGDRYGWVPDTLPPGLAQAEPWLEEHRGKSVTELEIIHGVLRNPDMQARSFFYFRSHQASARVASEGSFPVEPPASSEKLARLKDAIRAAHARGQCALLENYESPEMLGRQIAGDFAALLDVRHPRSAAHDAFEQSRVAHAVFARVRSRVYVKSGTAVDDLNRFMRDGHRGTGAVVSGAPGSGKSALLAHWSATLPSTTAVVAHYVAAAQDGSDGPAMLRRLMEELNHRFGLQHAVPDDARALRRAFNALLDAASASTASPFVLLVDGLDRVTDRGSATAVSWLPPIVPSNVRLVVSSRSEETAAALARGGWMRIAVGPLATGERIDLTRRYLAEHSKELSAEHLTRITSSPHTGNPLYLRTLLDELRVFGSHERLDAEIDRYLAAESVPELFGLVLARCERDYDPAGGSIVKPALSLLWAAHGGLTEMELLDLLGRDGTRLPRARWSPIFLALEGSIFNRNGLLSLAHEYLAAAVHARYVETDANRQALHLRLANYFDREIEMPELSATLTPYFEQPATTLIPFRVLAEAGIPARKCAELPWQLAEGGLWPRLYALLTDYEFLAAHWKADAAGTVRLWDRLETEGGFSREKAYADVIDGRDVPSWWSRRAIIQLLEERRPELSELIRAMETSRLTQSANAGSILTEGMQRDTEFADWMIDLFVSDLASRPDTKETRDRFAELAGIARDLGRKQALARISVEIGRLRSARGELKAAEHALGEAESIASEIHDDTLVAEVHTVRAAALASKRADDEAFAQLDRQAAICRRLGCWKLLATGLNIGAGLAVRRKEHERALTFARDAEALARQHHLPRELERAAFVQAVVFNRQGLRKESLACFRAAEDSLRSELRASPIELELNARLAENLVMQAVLSAELGDCAGARRLAEEAAGTCRRFPEARNRPFVESTVKWVGERCP